jgi:hypothetical protein
MNTAAIKKEKIKCSTCGKVNSVDLIKVYIGNGGSRRNSHTVQRLYIDEHGRKSMGGICHSCTRNRDRALRGVGVRGASGNPKIKKAMQTELIAAKHFRKLGFKVRQTDCLGPDLVCSIGELRWTVEVKRARAVSPKKYPNGCFVVDGVSRQRTGDDLIAFVLPNNRVYIDSMKLHLENLHAEPKKRRPITPQRTVTAIVKEFGLPAKT